MNRYKTIGILLGAAMLTHASIASAQRWGRAATPRSGVCFYEDVNFGGRYFCSSPGTTTPAVPSGMNDRVSSVRVFGNSTVTVYRDNDFRGPSKIISSDVADMRGLGFNDRLSSYRVDAAGGFYGRDSRIAGERGQVAGTTGSRWTYGQAESIVRRSYRSVLGRDPDPSGLQSWTEQVRNNNWTQRDLENALRQSDEYRASHGSYRRR